MVPSKVRVMKEMKTEQIFDKKDHCLAEVSCHTFKSKRGVCSKRTQNIAALAMQSTYAVSGKKGKKQRSRENRKYAKLLKMPAPVTRNTTKELLSVISSCSKLYIGGMTKDNLPPNLPTGSIRWLVHENLLPFLNPYGVGCWDSSLYTLLPREWIRDCFPNTHKYFKLFMNLLHLHPGLDPSGSKKVPVYDKGAPETYLIVGTTARRFGKGLFLVDRKLASPSHMIERELLKKYFRMVAHASLSFLDTRSIRYLNCVKALTNFTKFSFDETDPTLIWLSLAVAANVVMEMHTDQDFLMGCASAIGGRGFRTHDPLGTDILQYFCFPTAGTAIGLRNGDLLLFNPQIPHCVSSKATMDEDVVCTSFYLKTAIVGGNDNDVKD